MADDAHWTLLLAELERWRAAGKRASLWLRDDDATEPTPALDRLLALCERHSLPVTLAVIPAFTGEPLARRLDQAPLATVAVHGWSHRNHADAGEKKQELGAHRPRQTVIGELENGLAVLGALYPRRLAPVLVPPWNRIDAALIPELGELGFRALSVYGPERDSPLRQINTHVDLMDWHGTRGGRDHALLVSDIVRRLAVTFESGGTVGILAHHLAHDNKAWNFLEELFARTATHPACGWRPIESLIADRDQR